MIRNVQYGLLGLFIITLSMGLTSCLGIDLSDDELEDKGPCFESTVDKYYRNLEVASFSVNGGESNHPNYTPYTQKQLSGGASETWSTLWVSEGQTGLLQLNFVRVEFEDDCTPYWKHAISLYIHMDQHPYGNSKTYQVGKGSDAEASAVYAFGEAVNEGELNRPTLDDAGTVTIDRWIAGTRVTGSFDIDIDGIEVKGRFDYDLTSDYTDF